MFTGAGRIGQEKPLSKAQIRATLFSSGKPHRAACNYGTFPDGHLGEYWLRVQGKRGIHYPVGCQKDLP